MISSVSQERLGISLWREREHEHEIFDQEGNILDLKADFGVDSISLKAGVLTISLSSAGGARVVILEWSNVDGMVMSTEGRTAVSEDGRLGLMYIAISSEACGLVFEVQLDWISFRFRAPQFALMGCV
ncbi:hypothetical protein [Arsenicicoccus bolidensis]|uniref:Uncharacterized protein n=1 Tax=Arsenicicoccus bolidensis TaxID=229480 RepID=A0ABS9Q799_9MICO|nr:hypothetical protein [Arsenicicoccus bolidensis]MCG7323748.1 hypothetical protein [Arsenicicoccus bolidensis]